MKNCFAVYAKRTLAVFLSLTVLFSAVACKNKKDPASNDLSSEDTTSATTTTPSETTKAKSEATTEMSEETTTETTEPEPTSVTGVYMMIYDTPPPGSAAYAVRMELFLEDDKLGVFFSKVYPSVIEDEPNVSFAYSYDGPFVADLKEEGSVITAEYAGNMHAFKISSDGKTADVSYSIYGYTYPDPQDGYSGHYIRQDHEEYSQNLAPVSGNDPATPGGSVDKVLAKLAREQLGLAEGSILTADDLSRIHYLNINGEYSTSLNGIEYFTNLQSILIQASYIQDISPLAELKSLEEFVIQEALVDTIPDLSSCTALKSLSIDGCAIRDITPVTLIGSLKNLSLCSNQITSVAPIKDMTALESLQLDDNPITDWETIEGNDKLISAIGQEYYNSYIKVLKKARSIVNETITSDMSDLEKEIAMCKKIHKISDMGSRERTFKYATSGYTVIMEGWGICMDYQEAVSLLMTLAGIECFGCHSSTHEWNVIKIDGVYYELDVMWTDDEPIDYWEEFNLSRGRMDELPSHHIEIVKYPTAECSMLRLEYLLPMNIICTD